MTVDELNREELNELKERYVTEDNRKAGRDTSWFEIESAPELITDQQVRERYAGRQFQKGDFLCNYAA